MLNQQIIYTESYIFQYFSWKFKLLKVVHDTLVVELHECVNTVKPLKSELIGAEAC